MTNLYPSVIQTILSVPTWKSLGEAIQIPACWNLQGVEALPHPSLVPASWIPTGLQVVLTATLSHIHISVCAYFKYLTLATQTRKNISSEIRCCSSGLPNNATPFLHSSVYLLKAWSHDLEKKGTSFWGWLIRKQKAQTCIYKKWIPYTNLRIFSICKNSIVPYTEKFNLV